ncbi:hypothetical protein BGZ76_006169, partial [Entomortierella beljakovae]
MTTSRESSVNRAAVFTSGAACPELELDTAPVERVTREDLLLKVDTNITPAPVGVDTTAPLVSPRSSFELPRNLPVDEVVIAPAPVVVEPLTEKELLVAKTLSKRVRPLAAGDPSYFAALDDIPQEDISTLVDESKDLENILNKLSIRVDFDLFISLRKLIKARERHSLECDTALKTTVESSFLEFLSQSKARLAVQVGETYSAISQIEPLANMYENELSTVKSLKRKLESVMGDSE